MRLPAQDARGVVIVVSGGRGAGKSTLLLALRTAALAAGLRVGGMISLARVADGFKAGIDVMDAASGTKTALADYQADLELTASGMRTGHYQFYPAGLAAGLRWAEAGRAAEVFIVDELGPLEFERGQGWAAAIPMIAARGFGCALVTVRPKLLDLARTQMALDGSAPVLTVEAANRDRLAAELGAWLAGRAKAAPEQP